MIKEKFLEYYSQHKGEVIGAGIGLVFAILVLSFGFWKVLFIILCSLAGFYLGKKGYDNKDYFKERYSKLVTFFKEK